jgi:hypothetical protein
MFIVTYQPRMALRSLSKENEGSNAKGQDDPYPFLGPLGPRTLLHATSINGDV